ncbi:MAG: hypothetical protein ACI8RE_003296 [Ilumatobacter sp.]|jgi:hypothetical protein
MTTLSATKRQNPQTDAQPEKSIYLMRAVFQAMMS